MEIKIDSLENIHEAAKKFIAAMGDNTVLPSMENGGRKDNLYQSRMRRTGRDGCH